MVRSPPGTGRTRRQLGEHMGNPEGQGLQPSDALWSQDPSSHSQNPLPPTLAQDLITRPRLDGQLDRHTKRTQTETQVPSESLWRA